MFQKCRIGISRRKRVCVQAVDVFSAESRFRPRGGLQEIHSGQNRIVSAVAQPSTSKRQAGAELDHSGAAARGDDAGADGDADVGAGIAQVGVVEHVEGLHADFEVDALGDGRLLEEGGISIDAAGALNAIGGGSAVSVGRGDCVGSGVEPLELIALAGIGIAHQVGAAGAVRGNRAGPPAGAPRSAERAA